MKTAAVLLLLFFTITGCTFNAYPKHPMIFEPGNIEATPNGCQHGVDC